MIFLGQKDNAATVALGSAGTSQVITNIGVPASLGLTPSGGTARVEYSLDPDLATWKSWTPGDVGTYTEQVLTAPVSGIRLVVGSGSATLFAVDRG